MFWVGIGLVWFSFHILLHANFSLPFQYVADKVTENLTTIIKKVSPGNIAPVTGIRKAMGIAPVPPQQTSSNSYSPHFVSFKNYLIFIFPFYSCKWRGKNYKFYLEIFEYYPGLLLCLAVEVTRSRPAGITEKPLHTCSFININNVLFEPMVRIDTVMQGGRM